MKSKPTSTELSRTPIGWAAVAAVIAWFLPITLFAAGLVSVPTEANLRAALAGGGTVTFASDGTIVVTSTLTINADTLLDGRGHQIVLSGGNLVRVFYVRTNINLTLSQITIANGQSDQGSGIFNAGGQVVLQNCTLANNSALGPAGGNFTGNPGSNSYGGAIYNLGLLKSLNCAFISNSVSGGNGAQTSAFGPGGAGGQGNGGAIGNFGTLILTSSLLANNVALGGSGAMGTTSAQGGAGGDANGGAIMNLGTLAMTDCLLMNNSGTGGMGGMGGSGPYSTYAIPGGPGGVGGSGNGGALYNQGAAVLLNNTVALNSGTGAQGGGGGQGSPPFSQSSTTGNGGNGADGGSGYGAIRDVTGQCYLTNCTLALNRSLPGIGGYGGQPGPWIYPYPPHLGSPGANGLSGSAGGALDANGAHLSNTLLAGNTPTNCTGTINDVGHNLSSDASAGLTGPGSLNNTDPRLGPPANNGGPTLTMALLPGSPAIDAGDTAAAPWSDQRGFPRPAGLAADIGAFESGSVMPTLRIVQSSPGLFDLLARGNTNQWCRLFASTNLLSWTAIGTNQLSGDGTAIVHDHWLAGPGGRFYRVVMP